MLDFRHETFITVCKRGSYTKAAEHLCITQPAVSQHIRFLENTYGGKLFEYKGKVLNLTDRGRRLRDFVMTVSVDGKRVGEMLRSESFEVQNIYFGATLSIGEYVMPKIIAKLLEERPNTHVTMLVNNTEVLIRKLNEGIISFALMDGFFDKAKYDYGLFYEERFITVCGPDCPLAGKPVRFSDLIEYRLILRETGSATRNAVEQILFEHNLTLDGFRSICEIGNMNAIKQLVTSNCGITFLHETVAEKGLRSGVLVEVDVQDFNVMRKFNSVFLKNSLHKNEYLRWIEYFKNALAKRQTVV